MIKKKEHASIILKIGILISLIIIFALGISVLAGNVDLNSVKIEFSNNHEITVVTSKTLVSDILKENNIMLASDEKVEPALDEEITDNKTIKISLTTENEVKASSFAVEENNNIIEDYTNITEQIITVREEIPFETITKNVSNGASNTTDRVLQQGKNGIKEVKYKVTYQNDVEIERIELSSTVITEPTNKIVQVQTVTSRSSSRTTSSTSATSGVYKITAYTASIECCGKTDGITASGVKATSNRTIAAPGTFAFGTKLLINGEVYVVEDRGGAIQGNRLDLYVDSYQEAVQWGVKYLEVEVLE